MSQFHIGSIVASTSGHDKNKIYIIKETNAEYVYLIDGRLRTLDHPKKKKKKHVNLLDVSEDLSKMLIDGCINDEKIKRAIKLWNLNRR